ncbi:methyl-accepting chemotaxis protein [Halobacillus locisalis]|uniref:Methyl-accepting chemotaxis protein n=1 Tax=Halobacillus locisalis TaxID=220753 RepID=A0A838CU12_9BACI|nr:HAMP domain-containing methyl-accepting chemotaxis protein [Halobacillus locisalis]MBA2175265.1 methyl-accepting chemotaxis protein [Halobacillus locisalis]
MSKQYKFSLRLKLVLFITGLAIVTYSFTALFIYGLHDAVQSFWAISEQTFTIITLLLGIFWSGVLGFFMSGFITRPLNRLEKVASLAADGNLTERVSVPKSDDEIRSLSLAFNSMIDHLSHVIENIDRHFEGTNQSVIHLKTAADQATEQARMISLTTQEISKGAEMSASSVQQNAESVEEATALADQVQQKAQQSRMKSNQMMSVLMDSEKSVHELIQGIQQVANEQEQSLKDVARLNQNAQEVEHIISLVGDISEQTNLLALNASIEAARAGEHGKGFAVVADEVRKLADQSASSVQKISGLIGTIQSDVALVVTQMNQQMERSTKEAEKGQETTQAIQLMNNSVNDVDLAIQDISEIVEKQLTSIQKSAKQSQDVAAVAEETSAGAEEVSASIQEQTSVIENMDELANALERQAQGLKDQIHRFRLTENK